MRYPSERLTDSSPLEQDSIRALCGYAVMSRCEGAMSTCGAVVCAVATVKSGPVMSSVVSVVMPKSDTVMFPCDFLSSMVRQLENK